MPSKLLVMPTHCSESNKIMQSPQEQEPKPRQFSLEAHRLDQLGSGLRNLLFARARMEPAAQSEPVYFQPSVPAGPVEVVAPIDNLASIRQEIEREAA